MEKHVKSKSRSVFHLGVEVPHKRGWPVGCHSLSAPSIDYHTYLISLKIDGKPVDTTSMFSIAGSRGHPYNTIFTPSACRRLLTLVPHILMRVNLGMAARR